MFCPRPIAVGPSPAIIITVFKQIYRLEKSSLGDSVKFDYTNSAAGGSHNVLEVTEEEYHKCEVNTEQQYASQNKSVSILCFIYSYVFIFNEFIDDYDNMILIVV